MVRPAPAYDPSSPVLTGEDDVRAFVAEHCLPDLPGPDGPGRVGLELERFPMSVRPDGGAGPRLPLAEAARLLDAVDGAVREPAGAAPAWRVGGGRLSFEPGGQVEYATAPLATGEAACRDLAEVSARADAALAAGGAVLAAAGLDVWHGDDEAPLEVRSPRYPAMAAYFRLRGHAGDVLLRRSCSLQVNVDLGPPAVAAQRWDVANLAAPLVVATFACSPVPGAVNGRALAWQQADPTRTGVPRLLAGGRSDPAAQVTAATLEADVLLVRRADGAHPGRPGWTFGDWLRGGSDRFGPPNLDDLHYHYTTLFPEIKARGYLEVRGIDALPRRWWDVPAVLVAGLLCDAGARAAAAEVLAPVRADGGALLARAARDGLADPALGPLAATVWGLALDGARRLGPGWFDPARVEAAAAWVDRYPARGRAPSDDLRRHLAAGPAAALRWAVDGDAPG
jgi:glutamate--cysteine ligase